MAKKKMKLLYLCTGNSCRSQMAEGWARELAGDVFDTQSAGIEAHGKNPLAIEVMAEAGVDISGQESTRLTDEMLQHADIVITVCGHADKVCPVLPDRVNKKHIPFPDPAKAQGSREEVLAQFRRVRDQIKQHVLALAAEYDSVD